MTDSLPNNDSDLDEEEKILDDLNLAIISACTNIQNCLKRKDFTNQSLENFKQNHAESYELLKKSANSEPSNVIDWIKILKNHIVQAKDETAGLIFEQTISKIIEKKERTNIKQDEIERIRKEFRDEYFKDMPKLEDDQQQTEYESVDENSDTETIATKKKKKNNVSSNNILTEIIKSFANIAKASKNLRIETLKDNKQDIQEWFKKFEIQTSQWSEDEKGHEVVSWLESSAFHYWELLPEKKKFNYKEIKSHLLQKFRACDSIYLAKTNFYSMKQHSNESVDEFVYRVRKCKQDWPEDEHKTFDKEFCSILKKGLKPEISKNLVVFESSYEHDIIKKAKEIESILRKESENKTLENATVSLEAAISLNCYKCKKTGHIARNCSQSGQTNNFQKFCLFCGKNNHIAIDCRLRKVQTKSRNITESDSPIKNNNKKYCSSCKMSNHNTKDCRNKKNLKFSKTVKCFSCNEEGHIAKNCQNENLNQ
jgi:hypothetical protein